MQYYLSKNLREEGPYSLPRLLAMRAAGRLEGEYYARAEDSDTWLPLAEMLDSQLPADEPPPAQIEGQAPSVPSPWRRVGRLAAIVRTCLWVELLLSLASIALAWNIPDILSSWLLQQDIESPLLEQFDEIDSRMIFVAVPQSLAALLTVVFFCRWFYAAACNARQISGKPLGMTPGSMVGSFFIPILNLWKPCAGMKLVYDAILGEKASCVRRSGIVTAWWVSFLLMGMAGRISFRYSMKVVQRYDEAEESWEHFLAYIRAEVLSYQWELAADALTIPAALLAIALVGRLTRAQNLLAPTDRRS